MKVSDIIVAEIQCQYLTYFRMKTLSILDVVVREVDVSEVREARHVSNLLYGIS